MVIRALSSFLAAVSKLSNRLLSTWLHFRIHNFPLAGNPHCCSCISIRVTYTVGVEQFYTRNCGELVKSLNPSRFLSTWEIHNSRICIRWGLHILNILQDVFIFFSQRDASSSTMQWRFYQPSLSGSTESKSGKILHYFFGITD